jgi:hypothetical protein
VIIRVFKLALCSRRRLAADCTGGGDHPHLVLGFFCRRRFSSVDTSAPRLPASRGCVCVSVGLQHLVLFVTFGVACAARSRLLIPLLVPSREANRRPNIFLFSGGPRALAVYSSGSRLSPRTGFIDVGLLRAERPLRPDFSSRASVFVVLIFPLQSRAPSGDPSAVRCSIFSSFSASGPSLGLHQLRPSLPSGAGAVLSPRSVLRSLASSFPVGLGQVASSTVCAHLRRLGLVLCKLA